MNRRSSSVGLKSAHWVPPHPVRISFLLLYSCSKEELPFKLYKRSIPLVAYQVVYKTEEKEFQIAEGSSEAEIEEKWKWLVTNLCPFLGSMSEKDAQTFVFGKINSLITESSQEQILGDKVEGSDIFLTRFKLPTEKVIASYTPCTLFLTENFPKTGSVYVSKNYFAFVSSMSKNILIPFTELVSVHMKDFDTLKMLGTIQLVTVLNEYTITTLFKKMNDLYVIVEQLWKRAMDNLEKSASSFKMGLEKQGITYSQEIPKDEVKVVSKETLKDKKQNENFCAMFNLPSSGTIFEEHEVHNLTIYTTESMTKPQESFTGTLYILSLPFLCFKGKNDNPHVNSCQIIIPFSEITSIERRKNNLNKSNYELSQLGVLPNYLNIKTSTHCFQFELINRSVVYTVVCDAVTDYKNQTIHDKIRLHPSIRNIQKMEYRFPLQQFMNRYDFSEDFNLRENTQMDSFMAYFRRWGSFLVQTPELMALVRGGIPLGLKPAMWQILSGGVWLMSISGKDYYSNLVNQSPESIKDILEQIEKDLHRSLPSVSIFKKEGQGIAPLRRVLQAYAIHNPKIGYCQSMNIVVAVLLLFLEEEQAFYVLAALIQKLPDYYGKEMIGSIVDIRIFTNLLSDKVPELTQHFKNINVDLTMIALPWFLCLFIDKVPWEVVLRVIDCFLAEGPNVLFQVGMAVLITHQEALMKLTDIVSITKFLEDATFHCETLCKLAFDQIQIDHSMVEEMRNIQKFQILQELNKRNFNAIFGDIKRKTRFTRSDLEQFYSDFKNHLPIDTTEFCLHIHEFKTLFFLHVVWWPQGYEEPIFHLYDKHHNGVVTFSDYVMMLDIVLHGTLLQHQQLAFELYSKNGILRGQDFVEVFPILRALNTHHNPPATHEDKQTEQSVVPTTQEDKQNQESFLNMCMEDPDKQITFQQFQDLTMSMVLFENCSI